MRKVGLAVVLILAIGLAFIYIYGEIEFGQTQVQTRQTSSRLGSPDLGYRIGLVPMGHQAPLALMEATLTQLAQSLIRHGLDVAIIDQESNWEGLDAILFLRVSQYEASTLPINRRVSAALDLEAITMSVGSDRYTNLSSSLDYAAESKGLMNTNALIKRTALALADKVVEGLGLTQNSPLHRVGEITLLGNGAFGYSLNPDEKREGTRLVPTHGSPQSTDFPLPLRVTDLERFSSRSPLMVSEFVFFETDLSWEQLDELYMNWLRDPQWLGHQIGGSSRSMRYWATGQDRAVEIIVNRGDSQGHWVTLAHHRLTEAGVLHQVLSSDPSPQLPLDHPENRAKAVQLLESVAHSPAEILRLAGRVQLDLALIEFLTSGEVDPEPGISLITQGARDQLDLLPILCFYHGLHQLDSQFTPDLLAWSQKIGEETRNLDIQAFGLGLDLIYSPSPRFRPQDQMDRLRSLWTLTNFIKIPSLQNLLYDEMVRQALLGGEAEQTWFLNNSIHGITHLLPRQELAKAVNQPGEEALTALSQIRGADLEVHLLTNYFLRELGRGSQTQPLLGYTPLEEELGWKVLGWRFPHIF